MSTRSRSFVLTITPHEGHPAARRFLSTPTGSSSPSSGIEHPETGQFQQRVVEFAAATHGGVALSELWTATRTARPLAAPVDA
jgi:hypothetical protein